MADNLSFLFLILRLVGDFLKLNYFDLLSPNPIRFQNFRIISPTLKDISSIGLSSYNKYLKILSMDTKSYFKSLGQEKQYETFSKEKKSSINIFDLLIITDYFMDLLLNLLNFFIKEDVIYSPNDKYFLIQDNKETIDTITKETYPEICDLILQCNYFKSNYNEDLSSVKSPKALEIMEKLKKGKIEKQTKADKNMELGNIISAVANKSSSLNIINIWDLTVYQLWDCFSRISNNNIYDIQSMIVATWGNKDNYFDETAWFKQIETDN